MTPQYSFSQIRNRLDDWRVFNNMVDSPYYRDAVYEKFSDAEYRRRYGALRKKCASTISTGRKRNETAAQFKLIAEGARIASKIIEL